ncbi:MAG: MlaD family protein [Candidatus Methylomirabilales bacterium]
MGKKANPAVIGGFIVGAVILITAGLVVFGGGQFWSPRVRWVSYFPGSVKGLGIGASVNFRGVDIGRVTHVKVTMDPGADTVLTPVYWEMDLSKVTIVGASAAERAKILSEEEERPIARALIKRGLRAQLQLQSFVTGQQFIQLDFHPDTPITLVGGDTTVPEFPAVPSGTEKLLKTIENLPVGELVDDARRVLKSLDQLVGTLDSETLPATHAAMSQAKEALARLDSETLPATRATLDQATETLATYREGSRVNYELENTLKEVATAARALRVLADYLERHPEALLSGKKGGPGGNQQ